MQALILTLRHMSARHRLGKEIRAEIRKLSGVELIIQTLQTSIEWVVLGPTVGLIRNLANMTQNHKVMEEYKVVARLCELIGHTVKAIALLVSEANTSPFHNYEYFHCPFSDNMNNMKTKMNIKRMSTPLKGQISKKY